MRAGACVKNGRPPPGAANLVQTRMRHGKSTGRVLSHPRLPPARGRDTIVASTEGSASRGPQIIDQDFGIPVASGRPSPTAPGNSLLTAIARAFDHPAAPYPVGLSLPTVPRERVIDASELSAAA